MAAVTQEYAVIRDYLLARFDTTDLYIHTGQYDDLGQLSFSSARNELYVTVIVDSGVISLGFELAEVGEFWEKIELCDPECLDKLRTSIDRHLPGCFKFEEA